MRSVRFERLLASTALGLVLVLSSHNARAQDAQKTEQQKIDAAVPVPDTTLPPPPTVKDLTPPSSMTDLSASKPGEAPAPLAESAAPKMDAAPTMAAPEPARAAEAPKPAPAAEPAKTEAAAPAPAMSAPTMTAGNAVSDRLRDVITGKQADRLFSRKNERAGVEQFYAARNYAPIWTANGAAAPRTASAIRQIETADAVGLDPSDYALPDFKAATTPEQIADAELKMTAAALLYARQAQVGRVSFARVTADAEFNQVAPEPADVLAKLAAGRQCRCDARCVQSADGRVQGAARQARRTAQERRRTGCGAGREGKPIARRSPKARSCVPA